MMTGEGKTLVIPGGIDRASVDGLADLLADALGRPAPVGAVPFVAPVLLFGRLAALAGLADGGESLGEPGPILLHESQMIEMLRPLRVGADLRADLRVGVESAEDALSRLDFSLTDESGVVVMRGQTGVQRLFDAGADFAPPVRYPRSRMGKISHEVSLRGITAAHLVTYSALTGDRNPIHANARAAARLGLAAPVVPGMILAGLAEFVLPPSCDAYRIGLMRIRFVAPLLQDQRFHIRSLVSEGRPDRLRQILTTEADHLICVADLHLKPR